MSYLLFIAITSTVWGWRKFYLNSKHTKADYYPGPGAGHQSWCCSLIGRRPVRKWQQPIESIYLFPNQSDLQHTTCQQHARPQRKVVCRVSSRIADVKSVINRTTGVSKSQRFVVIICTSRTGEWHLLHPTGWSGCACDALKRLASTQFSGWCWLWHVW